MFIYLENLEETENDDKEILLIPKPRYFKLKKVKKLKFIDVSWLFFFFLD